MSHANYIKEMNNILGRNNFGLVVKLEDFHFLEEIVTDAITPERRLSKHLSSSISPAIHDGEFYHYTPSVDAILKSKNLRLTSIKKRVAECEIKGMLSEFGFKYPLSLDPSTGKPRFLDTIANDIFYTSFTDTTLTQSEEQYFWDTFAKKDGARLKFRIRVGSGVLRRMVYGNEVCKWAKLFREISDLTDRELGKIFFWNDSAVFCALHLPNSYNVEKETRLITRRGCGLNIGNDGVNEFLELSFGDNAVLKINLQLIEIQTDRPVIDSCGANIIGRTFAGNAAI